MHPVKPSTSAEPPELRLPDGPPAADPPAGAGRLAPAEQDAPAGRARSSWMLVVEWAVLVVSALAIAVLIKAFLFQAFYIPSDSMVPTLKTNDRVIVNKLSYRLHPVHRGDIIVFRSPPNVDPSIKDLIKRVIALPGETVEGRNGHIYINDRALREPYLPKGQSPGPGFARIRVPPSSYWVMGDNRPNSRDSRFFPEHFIRKKDIIGRAFVRIWPFGRLGIL